MQCISRIFVKRIIKSALGNSLSNDDDYLENLTKQAKVWDYERQIDEMVYKLYNLTPDDIAIVEGKG